MAGAPSPCAPAAWSIWAASPCRWPSRLRILAALGCDVMEDRQGLLEVTTPSWRGDIHGEADLVEEVLRVHGYDAIPTVPLPRVAAITRPAVTEAQRGALGGQAGAGGTRTGRGCDLVVHAQPRRRRLRASSMTG